MYYYYYYRIFIWTSDHLNHKKLHVELSIHTVAASLSTLELNHFHMWDVCVAKIYIFFFCLNIDGFKVILWHEVALRLRPHSSRRVQTQSHQIWGEKKKEKRRTRASPFWSATQRIWRSSDPPAARRGAALLRGSIRLLPLPPSKHTAQAFTEASRWLTDWLALYLCVCVCVCVCGWVGVCVGYVHLKAASVSIDKQESERSCYRVKSK